ncbi:FliI/YscN family ATPase [Pseudoxanthomonas winnipegensis]
MVVAATAEEAPLVRVLATRTAHVIAEYFRDQGLDVLLVVDSMTRFAMAQREIGLAAGEPPTFRGYTPSVFAQLPQLVERCGRNGTGSITGIYSVLVEGDDMNEPVTDHMRAILDGHIVLDRKIASRGHYPAIDILHSASRLLPNLAGPEALQVAADVKRVLAVYEASRDLIELGAYQRGVNTALDEAVVAKPRLDSVLAQAKNDLRSRDRTLRSLQAALADDGAQR